MSILLPLYCFSQTETEKYKLVMRFIEDSIVKNRNEYYIDNQIKGKTDWTYFHGFSCSETQHQLILEIVENGTHSISTLIDPKLIPARNRNNENKYKVTLHTIVKYNNIWSTQIKVLNSDSEKWDWYSLIFIENDMIANFWSANWHAEH